MDHAMKNASWQARLAAYVVRHRVKPKLANMRDIASVRFPSDGGNQTLNRASPSFRGPRPFDAVHGAGAYRQAHIGIGRDRAKALADAAHLHRQGHGFIQYLQALSAM